MGAVQKYFIIGLAVLFLASAGAAISYRASYRVEHARRAAAEDSLRTTVQSLDDLVKNNKAALEAANRATAVASALAEQRRVQREIVIKAPSDQDGPVAPVLRDAINGVR